MYIFPCMYAVYSEETLCNQFRNCIYIMNITPQWWIVISYYLLKKKLGDILTHSNNDSNVNDISYSSFSSLHHSLSLIKLLQHGSKHKVHAVILCGELCTDSSSSWEMHEREDSGGSLLKWIRVAVDGIGSTQTLWWPITFNWESKLLINQEKHCKQKKN